MQDPGSHGQFRQSFYFTSGFDMSKSAVFPSRPSMVSLSLLLRTISQDIMGLFFVFLNSRRLLEEIWYAIVFFFLTGGSNGIYLFMRGRRSKYVQESTKYRVSYDAM